MRAKPSTNTRSAKANRANGKSYRGNVKGIAKKTKEPDIKIPDLSVLRQPVDTSVCGLKQAVKVFETGTPEVLHLLTYDCDVVYECKVCRNLFRSIANFISHKRVYCTVRYSRSQDLQRSKKEGEDYTLILGEKAPDRLPTRVTARRDLTSIVESISGQAPSQVHLDAAETGASRTADKKTTTVHLEPIDNTSFGVFQTVFNTDSQQLMRNQVTELHNLLSQDEVVLGPDGRILQNGLSDFHQEDEEEIELNDENGLVCSACNIKFANRKTLARHKRFSHESVRTRYICPCCKNYFANPWSVYRHLYKVHRKTNEQVRRLRPQIHKKDIRVEKPVVNNVNSKKVASPSKRKMETERHLRIQQDNKEWMDHFEDDNELQRCGGCGRKFERKAALISHSQICQKRIAACNRIEQNYHGTIKSNLVPVVAISPLPCSKKPIPKPSPEKKIGIQVRMNYCKSNTSCGSTFQVSERQRSCSRSILGDDSDLEATSVDGKDSLYQQAHSKPSLDTKESSILEQFFKSTNTCRAAEGVNKVTSYLNNSGNGLDKEDNYEISTFKRTTVLRSAVGKMKSLEAKCLQLRSALEGEVSGLKIDSKDKSIENGVYYDGNVDNTSESNTSAVSSLSSQLTPVADKGCVSEVEQTFETDMNTNEVENTPSTEADSTSMTHNSGLHVSVDGPAYADSAVSPDGGVACEEVSTSVISDDLPQQNSSPCVDSSCLNDDEISVDLKPSDSPQLESNNFIQGNELENTISILTRNQLKAICKDDVLTSNGESEKNPTNNMTKKNHIDADFEATTKEMMKKKLSKYIERSTNTCRICNKQFKREMNTFQHVPIHTRWKRYECLFNGCTFQTFLRRSCLSHVSTHVTECSGESMESLVKPIDPSRWNFRLLVKSKSFIQSAAVIKKTNLKLAKGTPTLKLSKTVKLTKKKVMPIMKEKAILKSKRIVQNERNKIKVAKVLKSGATKQKLLTDFKHFSEVSNLKNKSLPTIDMTKKKVLLAHKNGRLVNNYSPKSINSSPVKNGVAVKRGLPSKSVKSPMRKQKLNSSAKEQDPAEGKPSSVKKEAKEEDIDVNHIKSETSESQISVGIHTGEITDGTTSLEEEESQESDKAVDDSHLKKIFMEVIFGPRQAAPEQTSGRPVRNKARPKRDSDFILGSPKDSDKEASDTKANASKKSTKSTPDSKTAPEASRKSK